MLLFELLVILALVLLNAIFAGAEIAVVACRTLRLQQLASEGHRGAKAVLELRRQPDRFFATVQIGITVVGATAGALGGARLAAHLEPYLEPWVAAHAAPVSVAVVVALVSYLSIVLGELVPKSLALKHAEPFAFLIGRPLLTLSAAARPLVWFLTLCSNALLKPFGDTTTFGEAKISAEELQGLVGEASKTGAVDDHVGEIASRAFELQDLKAREVMVPRNLVDAIPIEASPEQLRTILLEKGHSRMPVYRDHLDDVVGYLVVRDVLSLIWEGELIKLHDVVRPAYFVPESMLARAILREFQRRHVQLAVVVDEHGGLAGIVTAEDIVEELVGELFSEDDPPEPLILREAESAVVRGTLPVREVNRALELELPESEDWNTVGGLCMHLAGGVPRQGARLTAGEVSLEIVEASARHVRLVRVRPLDPARGADAAR